MVIFPHVYKDIRYDTLKDFVPVATTHFGTLAFSIGPGVPDDATPTSSCNWFRIAAAAHPW
jgi:hypothetical protein